MATQTDTRKNIKVSEDTHELLNGERGDETWDEFLRRLVEEATIEREYNDISDARVEEIADRAADRVENRLAR